MNGQEQVGFGWLEQLPWWSQPQARAAFVADLRAQLGDGAEWSAVAMNTASQASITSAAQARAVVAQWCMDPNLPRARAVLAATTSDLGSGHLLPTALARLIGSAPRPAWRGAVHPGLRPFGVDEAAVFFGRGFELRRLRRLLAAPAGTPLLIAGAAGSGKSSLLRAGLLAAPGVGAAVLFEPAGGDPSPLEAFADALCHATGLAATEPRALAAELRRAADAPTAVMGELLRADALEAGCLLAVDGLEQLLAHPGPDAELVLGLLAATAALPQVNVVATLRADFLGGCIKRPELVAALHAGRVLALPTPSRDLLAWMLQAPLTQLTLAAPIQIAPEALSALADESASQPLPLLHLAARAPELYAGAGSGLGDEPAAGAFAPKPDIFGARCEVVLRDLGDAVRAALPRVLEPLVSVPVESDPVLSRQVSAAHWQDDVPAQRLVAALTRMQPPLLGLSAASSVSADEGQVHLAHDGLIQVWPQLADWIEQRRDGLRLAQRLRSALADWLAADRPNAGRWSHEQLEPAREQLRAVHLLATLEQDADLADFLTPEPERLLLEIEQDSTEGARREDIGLRLARIGDPRPGVLPVAGVPRPRWCRIPGGRVVLDGRRPVEVAPFGLAAYPVTHAQFEAFLRAADGFGSADWWQGAVPEPCATWLTDQRADYPVTQVSWRDAMAYCRWLSVRLGYPVRLPEEWEWQWAAQSAQEDFLYPWGPDWASGRANTDEARVGRTMAVGMYPDGCSRQGVFDLAGNVWEWCRGGFELPARAAGVPMSAGVIRGGSWRVNRGFARADFRLDALPEERLGSTGFRLACDLASLPEGAAAD